MSRSGTFHIRSKSLQRRAHQRRIRSNVACKSRSELRASAEEEEDGQRDCDRRDDDTAVLGGHDPADTAAREDRDRNATSPLGQLILLRRSVQHPEHACLPATVSGSFALGRTSCCDARKDPPVLAWRRA
eukprot:3168206-Rhodomonas_salina.2